MKTVNFNNGCIGIEINDLQQAMAYSSLGHHICHVNGCVVAIGYDEYGNEVEPDQSTIDQEVAEAFNEGYKLYAEVFVDCGKVVPDNATTMQSRFHIGQRVYALFDGRIEAVEVFKIKMEMAPEYDNGKNKIIGGYERKPIIGCRTHISSYEFFENELFLTPQELAESLLRNVKE